MSTKNLAAAVLVCVAGGAAGGCIDGGAFLSAHEHLAETRSLAAGGEFVLENVNGQVVVEAGATGQVRIEADKAASSDAMLRQVRVEIEGEGDRVEVRTRFPRGSWLFGGGGRVEYRVTVP